MPEKIYVKQQLLSTDQSKVIYPQTKAEIVWREDLSETVETSLQKLENKTNSSNGDSYILSSGADFGSINLQGQSGSLSPAYPKGMSQSIAEIDSDHIFKGIAIEGNIVSHEDGYSDSLTIPLTLKGECNQIGLNFKFHNDNYIHDYVWNEGGITSPSYNYLLSCLDGGMLMFEGDFLSYPYWRLYCETAGGISKGNENEDENNILSIPKITYNPTIGRFDTIENQVVEELSLVSLSASGDIRGNAVYGAVFNDYAEYRKSNELKPGLCVCETGNGELTISTERLQPGANIISDTFGFAIGETDECKTPIAVSGRVLVYPYENKEEYKPGDAVCSGPNGTISKMTREEIREYPERIVGTVSEIPTYETWGTNQVQIDGRIWIKVR